MERIPRRDSRPHQPVYKTGALLNRPQGSADVGVMDEKYSRPESHRKPSASQADVLLLHLGNVKSGAVCQCCPSAFCLEDRCARCYTNTAKLARDPTGPRLCKSPRMPQSPAALADALPMLRGDLQSAGPSKMAARAGIAPASSRLQRAAHLSELSDDC
jgi:hypothetical protein